MSTTEQALHAVSIHAQFCANEKTWACLKKISLGHTCYRTLVYPSSNLMLLSGQTPDFLCKGRLCLSEISTTSMLHFFQSGSRFPPAAQINLAARPRLAAAPLEACQTQGSFAAQARPGSLRAFYPASRLTSYYFLRASTALSKTRGLFCELLKGLFNARAVCVCVGPGLGLCKGPQGHGADAGGDCPPPLTASHWKKRGGHRRSATVRSERARGRTTVPSRRV